MSREVSEPWKGGQMGNDDSDFMKWAAITFVGIFACVAIDSIVETAISNATARTAMEQGYIQQWDEAARELRWVRESSQ